MGRWSSRALLLGCIAAAWLLATGAAWALTAEESCFVAKMNAERQAAGLAPMAAHDELVAVARRHTQTMADAGTIFHNPNLAQDGPDGWLSLGENVGMGRTCETLHAAFMASPGHRKNIMEPDFNFVGVGVVIAPDNTVFVTEMFMETKPAPSRPAPTETASSAPAPPPPSSRPAATAAPSTTTTRPAATPPPAAVQAEEPPPPPPPPGSKVTGRHAAYLLMLETEVDLTAEERAAYLELTKEAAERPKAPAKPRGFLARVVDFIGSVLSSLFP